MIKEIEIKQFGHLKFKVRKDFWDEKIIETEISGNEYFIPDGMKVLIDIGAHIGGTATKCASKGAVVYAFEPEKSNYELLVENVKLNGLEDKVHCFNLGVGTNNKLYLNDQNSGGFGSYASGKESQTVELISLKEVFEKNNIEKCDVLKLDCEGAEYDILFNELDFIKDRVEQISLELHYATKESISKELKEKYGLDYVADLKKKLEKYYTIAQYTSSASSARLLVCKKHVVDRIPFFGFHTTTKAQRDMMMYERPFELIDVDPKDLTRFPQIIWDQDRNVYYEFDIKPFTDTFKMFDELKEGDEFDLTTTPIWKEYSYKGEPQMIRLRGLYDLYMSIKTKGIHSPICVERTGERFDGSYRTMIAIHLGIPRVQAQFFKFDWRDMTEEYLRRKLIAHEKAFGADYYQFEYKPGMWNIEKGGSNYSENAKDRWELLDMVLQDLPGRTVLDLGCNEGYMAIQCALKGAKVIGYEYDKARISNAWLNKLIFEWVNQKDIDVKFINEDFTSVHLCKADVVLMLNVLYHIHDRQKQIDLLNNLSGTMVMQCNLRKSAEREHYYTSHPDDAMELLKKTGWDVIEVIDFGDKPLIIARKK